MDRRALKLKRVELDLSQRALAQRLDVTQNTISRWESGAAGIRHPRILQLALERLAEKETNGYDDEYLILERTRER